jgi:hypothetical protein
MTTKKEIRMRKYFIVILAAALLAACAPTEVSTPLPTPSAVWTVRFTQSGGIMGMLRSIEVSSFGRFTAADERAQKTVDGQLSASELASLADLLREAAQLKPIQPNNECADCFIYTIEISGFGKPLQLQANDINLPDSGLIPLIEFLQGVTDEALN